MTPTTPTFTLEEKNAGAQPVVFAKDQPEYLPLPALVRPDGVVVTAWTPDDRELQALLAGEPVMIEVWTFGHPLQPLRVSVPPREA